MFIYEDVPPKNGDVPQIAMAGADPTLMTQKTIIINFSKPIFNHYNWSREIFTYIIYH